MICKCKGCCTTAMIGGALVVIGGFNWGLIGLGMLIGSDLNVVHMILGKLPMVIESLVYLAVGVATIGILIGCKCAKCKSCTVGDDAMKVSEAPKSM